MRKLIPLLFCGLLISAASSAQVSFSVQEPSPNAGGYEISVADGADWGSPDMTDPANVVVGTMCLAQNDSLVCDGVDNGPDLDGKIAVVYRGACEFGLKAFEVQSAGAIACIIVNHSPGVIPMGGGAFGTEVTIPVIMISNSDGANLYDDFASCGSEAIIGNLNGFFTDNVRLTQGTLLRPTNYGTVAELSQDDSEFDVELGAWVYNFGQNTDDNVVLNVTVEVDGTEIFNESSAATSIAAGDSAYVAMPVFSQASYMDGRHTVTYSVSGTNPDEFMADNMSPADFHMGNTFAYSRLDDQNRASPTNYTSAATSVGAHNYCIMFEDPNASRIAVTAFDFSGTHFTDVVTDMEVEIVIYEWNDPYDGLNTTLDDVAELESESYAFAEGDDDQIITLPFDTPVELDDDQRYAFCLRHTEVDLQLGFDNKTDYTANVDLNEMPIFPQWDDDGAFTLGFGADLAPAFSVQTVALASSVDEFSNDVDVTPFPNPVAEMLNIPFKQNALGKTLLSIFDVNGKLVSAQQVNPNGANLEVDVTGIENGNYVFNLRYENGTESTFNVVVDR